MTEYLKGARPIQIQEVLVHYENFKFIKVDKDSYSNVWRQWLTYSNLKTLANLDQFTHVDYTAGTSQTFDHFALKHANRHIRMLRGDFQYTACIARHNNFSYLDKNSIESGQALIISLPFSDYGKEHPEFRSILDRCNQLQIPVCLDLAYWGIAKNVHIDLAHYPCITEITSSLSKPFYVLENHRVGVRFSRSYQNDGISMLNEVNQQNFYSMSLGMYFMRQFSCDWIWNIHEQQYKNICHDHQLTPTDTVIFALGDQDRHREFNRGIENNFRVCISNFFV